MKATIGFSLGLAVALIPFAGGGDPTSTNSNPEVAPADQVSGDSSNDASSAINILPGPDIPPSAEATGPGTTVPPAPRVSLTPPAADVAKLAQAGVDESVMLTFITNSPNTFNLSSDAIVYLNDLGISSEVVNAMIQHDQTLRANIALSPTPTAEFNPPLPANAGAGNPVDTTNPDSTASTQTEPTYTENPPDLTENAEAAAEPNGSYTYFYNSLAPYGSWISVGGY